MRGQVVYMYAYDVAYEIDLQKARDSLTQAQFLQVPPGKTVPRDFPFYQPLYMPLGTIRVKSPTGELTLRREVKIFSVGAISIFIRVDFDTAGLGDLTRYHSLPLENGRTIDDVAGDLCEEIFPNLRPSCVRPAPNKGDPEAYTVFCLVDKIPRIENLTAQQWLEEWRGEVAGLLTEEKNFDRLSDSEIQETTRYNYSYAIDDLIVIDWDGALILDPEGQYEDLLYILEVANVQLTEFQLHDQILERSLDQAYDDIEAYSRKAPFLKGPGPILRRLQGVLVDLTKMSDEITNITKFFGDWHLARIYMGCSERFHLKEWENSLEGKLKTLDSLYKMLLDDWNERRMLLLELAIVLLFVIDVVKLFAAR